MLIVNEAIPQTRNMVPRARVNLDGVHTPRIPRAYPAHKLPRKDKPSGEVGSGCRVGTADKSGMGIARWRISEISAGSFATNYLYVQ